MQLSPTSSSAGIVVLVHSSWLASCFERFLTCSMFNLLLLSVSVIFFLQTIEISVFSLFLPEKLVHVRLFESEFTADKNELMTPLLTQRIL